MEEDDLLTPYKEVPYEEYEQKDDDSSAWETTSDDSEVELVEEELEKVNNAEITEQKILPPVDVSNVPKRGRPRKPKPQVPEAAKLNAGDSSMQVIDCKDSETKLADGEPDKVNTETNKELPPINVTCIPKRGRPRKPKPPTPDPSELQNNSQDLESDLSASMHNGTGVSLELNGSIDADTSTADTSGISTPGFKRTRGRPRRGESTVNSQKQLMQSLKYIIPDGTKRKSRPSRFLDDYDAFLPSAPPSDSDEPKTKRPRGRPRIKPPKVRVLLPDGTPRGRGRPRMNPFIGPLGESAMKRLLLIQSDEVIDVKKEDTLEESGTSQPTTSLMAARQGTTNGSLNGGAFIKPRLGRPRKYPIAEKIQKLKKRVAKPGKKLGRPKKGFEKWRKLKPEAMSVPNQKWQIKLDGLLKYVTGGKIQCFKSEILWKPNGFSTPNVKTADPTTEDKLECNEMVRIHSFAEYSQEGAENQVSSSALPPNNPNCSDASTTQLNLEASTVNETNSMENKAVAEDIKVQLTKTHSAVIQNGSCTSPHTPQQFPASIKASEDSNHDGDESDLSTELSSESEYSDMDEVMSVDDSSDEDDDELRSANETIQTSRDTPKTINESNMTNSSLEMLS